ncbi:ABC transporter permease [Paenibacillus roseipurpureus]|uniref:ABC-2 family transporter protein n=1 Tax=Paenibacillus roseopurpureus TaxID=2918901 RepID=A0AA96LT79_9BACL|nr:ABC-2 family transporter protein [Paenibacillus sp. MBLB1832]WNR46883.1 ABC-2 family transporter protein [Paenibacillus sp. MBLB1832]
MYFAKFIGFATDFIMIWLLVYRFQSVAGWNTYEIMLLYALNLVSYSFSAFFLFHPFTKLSSRIQSGEFDEILTKPLNPFLYLACREFSTGYLSNLTVAFSVLAFTFFKLQIPLSPANIGFLIVTVLGGSLIQGAAFILTNTPSFWIVKNNRLQSLLMGVPSNFVRYPITAYNKAIQIILTVVLPYAFISYYPAQFFLKKQETVLFPQTLQYMTLAVGGVLFFIAYQYWKLGLKHYNSTGS